MHILMMGVVLHLQTLGGGRGVVLDSRRLMESEGTRKDIAQLPLVFLLPAVFRYRPGICWDLQMEH